MSFMQMGDGAMSIDEVAERIQCTLPELTDLCLTSLGMAPSFVLRLIRLQALLEAASFGTGKALSGLLQPYGFQDQGHLNREMRLIYGTTPSNWLRQSAIKQRRKYLQHLGGYWRKL